jgi:hypothetical protein
VYLPALVAEVPLDLTESPGWAYAAKLSPIAVSKWLIALSSPT